MPWPMSNDHQPLINHHPIETSRSGRRIARRRTSRSELSPCADSRTQQLLADLARKSSDRTLNPDERRIDEAYPARLPHPPPPKP